MDRRSVLKSVGIAGIASTGVATALTSDEQTQQGSGEKNGSNNEEGSDDSYQVESTTDNVVWGAIDPTKDPVVTVPSGSTVEIETLSHEGILADQGNPADFFPERGIAREDVLDDQIAVYENVPHDGDGPHVVTGPVAIENAEPGDILEVEVRDIEFRVPYGTNTFRQGKGGLPTEFTWNDSEVIEFDLDREVAMLSDSIEIPLEPFLGIMATGPSPTTGRVNSVPPGPFGGNIDIQGTGVGTTLYFPVFQPGALFFTGDGHALQGNGEVDLTALETSLTGTFEFTLHKDTPRMDWPIAETADDVYVTGINEDLDAGMRQAIEEAVSMLVQQKGMTPEEAYRLCSLAVDFNVSQVVDINKGIHGKIPKSIFDDGFEVDPQNLGETF
jgi:acetamidase/formamidase